MFYRSALVLLLLVTAACAGDESFSSDLPDPGGKADSPFDETKARLVGIVTNEATGQPIAKVRMLILGHSEQVLSDERGIFELTNIDPGTYTVVGIAGEPNCSLVTTPIERTLVAGVNAMEVTLAAPPETLQRKVLVINYDPVLEHLGGIRLNAYRQWNDPHDLMAETFASIAMCSGNFLHYQVADWLEVDAIPMLEDGHVYGDEEYLDIVNGVLPGHDPSMADPLQILADFDVLARVDSGEIDEVVMWGGPYMGFFESRMIGPSPYWVNGPQVHTNSARNFVLMGLNPERGVAEALHSYGHRIESNLAYELGGGMWSPQAPQSKWDRFTAYDLVQAGNAGCGTVHHPANAVQDYDYMNPAEVPSRCAQYLAWPVVDANLVETVSSSTWGGDDFHRNYLEWWMAHIPRFVGSDAEGDLNNWWKYVADFD